MYCNNCGAFVSDENARFCHNCGSQLSGNNLPQGEGNCNAYPAQVQGEDVYNSYPDMPQGDFNHYNNQSVQQNAALDNGKKKTVIVAVAAVVSVAVICVLIIVGFLFSSGREVNGTDIYVDLKAGVRAQVVDVPDSDYLQMHVEPSAEAETSLEIKEGEYVDILNDYNEENGGYIFVRYLEDGEDYNDGWVLGEYLIKVSMTDDYKTLKKDAVCRVLRQTAESKGVFVYKEPNRKSDLITEVPESDFVKVLKDYDEQDGEFVFVEYSYGDETYEGWAHGKYLVFERWDRQQEHTEEQVTEPTKGDVKFRKGDVCVIGTNTPYHDGVTMRSQASFNSAAVRVIAEREYVIVTADFHESNNGYVQCFYDDGIDMDSGWISAKFMEYVTHWNGNPQLYYNAIGGYPSVKDTTTTFYKGGPGSSAYKDFDEGDWCYVGYETVGHDGLNLRSGPSSSSSLIMVVEEGTDAYVLKDYSSSDNGYIKVEVYGYTGYLMGKYLVYSHSQEKTTTTEHTIYYPETTTTEPTTEETTTETTTTESTTAETTTTETTTTETTTQVTTAATEPETVGQGEYGAMEAMDEEY